LIDLVACIAIHFHPKRIAGLCFAVCLLRISIFGALASFDTYHPSGYYSRLVCLSVIFSKKRCFMLHTFAGGRLF
jgi:hypothetical protein